MLLHLKFNNWGVSRYLNTVNQLLCACEKYVSLIVANISRRGQVLGAEEQNLCVAKSRREPFFPGNSEIKLLQYYFIKFGGSRDCIYKMTLQFPIAKQNGIISMGA